MSTQYIRIHNTIATTHWHNKNRLEVIIIAETVLPHGTRKIDNDLFQKSCLLSEEISDQDSNL